MPIVLAVLENCSVVQEIVRDIEREAYRYIRRRGRKRDFNLHETKAPQSLGEKSAAATLRIASKVDPKIERQMIDSGAICKIAKKLFLT